MQIVLTIGIIVMFILSLVLLIRSEVLRSRQIKDLKQEIDRLKLDSQIYALEGNSLPTREVIFLILDYLNLQLSVEAHVKLIERKKSSK